MKLTTFIKAERTSMDHVEVEYKLNETGESFTVTWFIDYYNCGVINIYELDAMVKSDNEDLAERVSDAIRSGESDNNVDAELYLEIRDTFDAQQAKEFEVLKLEHEYNEYVVGYVVTDKNTGRTVNFQFKNNGALDYGLEGDDTYQAFKENELEAIKQWLRAHDDVDSLEDAYADAMELPRDENGIHPIAEILANGNGITKQQIIDLAQANQ